MNQFIIAGCRFGLVAFVVLVGPVSAMDHVLSSPSALHPTEAKEELLRPVSPESTDSERALTEPSESLALENPNAAGENKPALSPTDGTSGEAGVAPGVPRSPHGPTDPGTESSNSSLNP